MARRLVLYLIGAAIVVLIYGRWVRETAPPEAAGVSCGVDASTVMNGEGIGNLRIGASVRDVALACPIISDTVLPGPEGSMERSLFVDLMRDTVRAVVTDESIWRIHVTSPGIRTEGGLGVGSRTPALRDLPGARVISGEGHAFVIASSPCGMSFRLRDLDSVMPRPVAELPDSVSVDMVLLTGCAT